MLTCQVVETDTTKVVPDQSKLDPSVVQLQPFEIIGGVEGAGHARAGQALLSGTSTGCG